MDFFLELLYFLLCSGYRYFYCVWDGEKDETVAIDFREEAPKGAQK